MLSGAETLQKGVGYILTAALAACLILAWILTAPLLRWGVALSDYYRKRFHSELG
jgi:hypothetical protein